MKLSNLRSGEVGTVLKVRGRGSFRKRMLDMGFVPGKNVVALLNAPLKDPVKYKIMEYEVSLRQSEADLIEITVDNELKQNVSMELTSEQRESRVFSTEKEICVALLGNPNAGKTSLFNVATGAHERVGNYSGVTVESKEARFSYKGYKFKFVDLPGTYSLSTYSPEEIYVRKYITEENPDIVLNVIDASNLERNLYLTTQLIDMDTYMVIALNMYDELEESGSKLDHNMLGKLLGIPFVPTISNRGKGIDELLDKIIEAYENREPNIRHIHINYGETLEKGILAVKRELSESSKISATHSRRHLAITLLERDAESEKFIEKLPNKEAIKNVCEEEIKRIETNLKEDPTSAFASARYGFISGALRETFVESESKKPTIAQIIDPIVTHKYFGYPIFLLLMYFMFWCTFSLGAYPQEWIEIGINNLASWVESMLSEGVLSSLIVSGIIKGVGGVVSFLPNILILYLFISFMEDSGYMSRAAFIMDKIMHKIGLHGKSFIPLLMGFGCGVPAVLATRTIESRTNRFITILLIPFMSCSARLPVYVLLSGTFFAEHSGTVLFFMYLLGVLLAVVSAKLFKRFLFKTEDLPFVMELPPYRRPTTVSVIKHLWQKTRQYLQKMGGIILISSILIWFLSYYPQNEEIRNLYDAKILEIEACRNLQEAKTNDFDENRNLQEAKTNESEDFRNLQAIKTLENEKNSKLQEATYIGMIGRAIEPVMRPLGFDERISVALLSGMAAKEVIISTTGILFAAGEDEELLSEKLRTAKRSDGRNLLDPLTAICLMIFILIYFPCVATLISIKHEMGSWRWPFFALIYTTTLAWVVSFIVKTVGELFIGS